MALTETTFDNWLQTFGQSWSALDSDCIVELFSEDVSFYWTPFEAPSKGRTALLAAMRERLSRQKDPVMDFEVITTNEDGGWAHWTASFTRDGTDDPVRIDGVLKATFRGTECSEYRQWQHVLEPGQGDLMRDFDA
ncbi:MAG TPA: nuclear transport factor 2 family protein [Henriciella marina]|uniref:nuclear transport factor 2 family protein n=1 Tax=Henriciella sp. TaxID=1968823 RepID=UPI0017BF116B|nr:nuclear transport factor 2 family protein [Henriciella sp.]HIG22039.1 nuclear transport factor 2 family protein [Henriciella sp.]HIK65698.1 nuclear transport factor 2 family protein [Henriciella marina]